MKGRVRTMKQTNGTTTVALAQRPAVTALKTGDAAPDAFRDQERFWNQVRRRIIARQPDAAKNSERLY